MDWSRIFKVVSQLTQRSFLLTDRVLAINRGPILLIVSKQEKPARLVTMSGQ